ncbi:class I SAM-dependent methyltransferase [Corynebacterium propinquum]|uniref:class I SAM-dependent methyltransferase n=1 Tax=Corynebacterium propinquum TaxID=43769 RepID=UPI002543B2F9|nr:class I SAM-dependent methyltransferase [Corynebacterium propinquum]MDK4293035.1 class I SAM-dependent methyltransferase [Corynebacterium propinquum]
MPTWNDLTRNNPSHSENYAARWKRFVAEGKDIDGEARFIDALSPRGARILDAGCGTGRAGGPLIDRGHTVAGIDLDPVLINHAKHDFPNGEWHVGDLGSATLYDQPELGHMRGSFDVVFSVGNVLGFIDPVDREHAIENLYAPLRPGGRAVLAFGAGRGWGFSEFLDSCTAAGFAQDLLLSSFNIEPFDTDSDFLIAVLRRPQ